MLEAVINVGVICNGEEPCADVFFAVKLIQCAKCLAEGLLRYFFCRVPVSGKAAEIVKDILEIGW